MGSEVDEIVSNYPRSAEISTLSPKLARLVAKSIFMLRIWAVVPHIVWTIRAVLIGQNWISGAALEFTDVLQQGLFVALGVFTGVEVGRLHREATRPRTQRIWAFFLVFVGIFPIVGAIGPVLLVYKLSQEMNGRGDWTRATLDQEGRPELNA